MQQAICDNWDQHWTDFSEASEMGPATKYRQRLAIKLLAVGAKGDGVRMLDIGSGTGGFAQVFCARFSQAKYHGLELSPTGVALAGRRVPQAEFEQRDLLAALPEGDSARLQATHFQATHFQATHAVCCEVLEHLDEPAVLLRNAAAYMAPGCRLVVTVPGGRPNLFDRYIGHRRHYTGFELRQLLESAGFEVERAIGAGFPFFNLYRLLTTWRGERLKQDASGPPSLLVRAGSVIFGLLFRFNLLGAGWQTVAVARYRP